MIHCRQFKRWMTLLATAALMTAVLGCESEKVVRYDTILSGLPGASGGLSGDPSVGRGPIKGAVDLSKLPDGKLLADNPLAPNDPSKRLMVAKNAQHLMVHIYNSLDKRDKTFFTSQVLSDITRSEYGARGKNPGEAYDYLLTQLDEIQALFAAMPSGEQTPGAVVQTVGPGVTRVTMSGLGAKNLKWIGFDMAFERGNYKLRWFVPAP